jgi:ATP/maltotriose-dependent transcriptional regulator MalT
MAVTAWQTKLVGRAGELVQLEEEWRRAASGQFRCVLVEGDPGVGKTRLVEELAARHRRRAVILSARAYPLGTTASFGLWAEALEGQLRGLPADEISRLCGGFLDDLAELLRSVAAVRGAAPDHGPPRFRVLDGLAVVLANMAQQAPVVTLLDDVHLADDSSWQALGYLAHNLVGARVLVLAVARPAELAAQPAATEVLLGLEQEGLLRRLPLGPLDNRAVGELAEVFLQGYRPPKALVEWLEDRSRGNPLFALGLLQALEDEGADLSAPELRSVPESLADRVRSRLRLLDEANLATLAVLALLERRVGLEDLVRVTGQPLGQLAAILERLVASRLVHEEERGRELTYEIAHPLIQDTVYQSIGLARRRELHRQVGRTLLAAGRLAEAAPHYARSAQTGEPEAIGVLLDAVRQADKREAYPEALSLLAAMVGLLPGGDERWVDVLDAMSWQADWLVDHRADVNAIMGIRAMRAIEEVLQRSPDPARRAAVKSRLASFLTWGTGELEEAERACAEAVELFEQAGDHPKMLLAAVELAWIRGLRGDLAAWETGAQGVVEAAETAGRFVLQQALETKGWAAFWRGRFTQAEDAFRTAIAMAREDRKLYRLAWNLASLALTLAIEGRFAEAAPLLEEARSVTPAWRETMLLEQETTIRWLAGAFPAAVASGREAVVQNPTGSRRRSIGMAIAAAAAADTGDLAEAQAFLDRAKAACRDFDWLFYAEYCAYAEAVIAWRDGRTDDALAGLQGVHSNMLSWQSWPFFAMVLVDLAEVAAERARTDVAGEAAESLGRVSATLDRPLYRGMAALGTAWARLASGFPDQAAEAASQAVELFSAVSAQAYLGRALDVLGRSLADTDRSGGREALRQAAETFEACGAVWRRDRALAALGQLGGAGRRMVGAVRGAGSLTRREREVARLAAHGLSAKEIAQQLAIGERTVETHLARAYAKLGLASKIDLVRRASELEL